MDSKIAFENTAIDHITAAIYKEEELFVSSYRKFSNDFLSDDTKIGNIIYNRICSLFNCIAVSTRFPVQSQGNIIFQYFVDIGFLETENNLKYKPTKKALDIYNSIAADSGHDKIKADDVELTNFPLEKKVNA